MKELKILAPCGMLGYGYPMSSFMKGIEKHPDAIIVDAGSTDAGPYKLGFGAGIVSRQATKKDLELMLVWGYKLSVPVIITSAGGAGAKPHIDWTMEIVKEIVKENDLSFKTAVIYSDVDKSVVKQKMDDNLIYPLGSAPELTAEILKKTSNIVGQMGHEPIVESLNNGAQLVVAGRAYDPAPFAAVAIREGFDLALAYHLGKILECGALCAEPGAANDSIMGYLREDHFLIEALNENRSCSTVSIAAHTLYEKEHPYILHGPGLELNLLNCSFEQFSAKTVKVMGSEATVPEQYRVKIEGAAMVAYRTFVIAGIRDPVMVEKIDIVKDEVVKQVNDYFNKIPKTDYEIIFHIYGKNGVMGALEPSKQIAHELGIVIDVVAPTQEIANTICASARSIMLHYGYAGRKTTAGNLAFLYSPSDVEFGPVYKFTIYHLVDVAEPDELCRTEYAFIG